MSHPVGANIHSACDKCHKDFETSDDWMEWGYVTKVKVKDTTPYKYTVTNRDLYCKECYEGI